MLAQTLNSTPLHQTDQYSEHNPDQELDQEDLVETDPDQLLRECKEALHGRPARPHRDLVHLKGAAPCSEKQSPPIRVMQWNILAQGKCL